MTTPRSALAALILGIAAVSAAHVLFALHAPYPTPPRFSADPTLRYSLPLLIGGSVVILLATLRWPPPVLRPGEAPPDTERGSRGHAGTVLLVLLLAFAVRAYRITEMPPPLFDDEANLALDAMKYLDGQFPAGTLTGWFETPLAFTAVNSLALKYFGPTVLGSRVTGLVFSSLTPLALYGVARVMMGPSAALFVMLALALQRWHVTISRFGANHITLPFVVALAFLFMARAFDLVLGAEPTLRALRRRARTDTVSDDEGTAPAGDSERVAWYARPLVSATVGGLFLGACMYTYLVSRLVALATFLFLAYSAVFALILYRRGGPALARPFRQRIVAIVACGFAYLVVFAPLANHYLQHPWMFTNRYKSISLPAQMGIGTDRINWQPLLTNLAAYPLMLSYAANEVPRYGPPYRPVLNAICGTLFTIGLVLLLRHWWRPANLFCLLWVAMPLLGGVITWSETPSPFRTLVASTGVAVIMLVPVYYAMLWGARQPGWWRKGRRVFLAVVAALLLVSGVWDLYVYWFVQQFEPNLYRYCNYSEYAVAKRVRELPAADPVFLQPHLYNFSSVRLLNWKRPQTNLFVPSQHVPLLYPEDVDAHVLVGLAPVDTVRALQLFQPAVTWTNNALPETPGFGFAEIVVPARQLAESRGMWLALDSGPRQQVRRLDPPPDRANLRATWEATLDVPRAGTYRFDVRSSQPLADRFRLMAGDQVILNPQQEIHLLAGAAPLRLAAQTVGPGERVELHWRPPGKEWEEIPLNRLYALPDAGSHGLRGTYYRGMEPTGTPFAQRVDLFLAADDSIPSPHSVRWTGFLHIEKEGPHSFDVRADDGVRLWLDGALLVDRWEAGGTATGSVTLPLAVGAHPIQVDYFDQGGGRIFELTWRAPGGKAGAIPFEALSHPPLEVSDRPFDAGPQ